MSVNWYESFKEIPWDKAVGAASSIAERGNSLWNRLTSRKASQATMTPVAPATVAAADQSIAALEVRCHALEARARDAEEELSASFEVVHSLAQQHSEFARVIDVLVSRTRLLLRICAVLGLGLVALAVVVLAVR